MNALVHIPGVCPGVPSAVKVDQEHFGALQILQFWTAYPPSKACNGGINPKWLGSHRGMTDREYEEEVKGNGMIFLRQPEQRIVSAYKETYHSWPLEEKRRFPGSITEFAKQVQGCAVRMLTRPGNSEKDLHIRPDLGPHWGGPCGAGPPPTPQEVALAKRRLREGFIFVGLTDEWQMSMCLLHAKFGHACEAPEFADNRKGAQRKASLEPYSLEALEGFTDPYDAELYEEATAIMHEQLRAYNLTASSCKPCFDEAGVEYPGA